MPSYKIITCIKCGKEKKQTQSYSGKYCSNKCQAQDRSDAVVNAWINGNDPGWTGKTIQIKKAVRSYLINIRGSACEKCGWSGRHPDDGSLLLEVDHIDGNPKNNLQNNLQVLCYNCHAMTSTFRRRNSSSARERKKPTELDE